MSDQDQKSVSAALTYIKSKIDGLIQGAKCEPQHDRERGVYRFRIFLTGKDQCAAEFVFSEENMEDFSADNTDYGIRFRYYIDFKIYIELTKAGLLPSFRISQKFMEEATERRDWWNDQYVRVAFDNKITAVLSSGLKKLKELLEKTLNEKAVDASRLSGLKEDLDVTGSIIAYYDVHKSLDETAAGIKSLSNLKAAAIYEIVDRERRRDNNRPYLTSKIHEEICWITTFLREGVFLEVRPPDWLIDYVAV